MSLINLIEFISILTMLFCMFKIATFIAHDGKPPLAQYTILAVISIIVCVSTFLTPVQNFFSTIEKNQFSVVLSEAADEDSITNNSLFNFSCQKKNNISSKGR